ncbi:hypothetical protein P4O66_007149 [Electrophorus voltai]|uniref:Uncharacterized protein n=1 Tax=Electrophorus voltai TaxID=2609070 RepID=A0AAD9DYM4_9TELE|nr:hypothetical protein P4O66_007149 [Electrophorus voltai]
MGSFSSALIHAVPGSPLWLEGKYGRQITGITATKVERAHLGTVERKTSDGVVKVSDFINSCKVTAVHKGLDRCAALLSGILQAEKTAEFKSQSRVPKTTSSKPRSKLSSGKMEAERKRLGKKSSSVTHLAKRPTPVQKTILSAQSCPGLRGQPCFQDEQHPPAVDMVTRSEVKQPRLNPGTQTEHVQPHSVPLGCSVSDSRNGLSLTEQQTSTVFNCRLTTSTPALSPQTPTSVHSQVSHAGSGGETQHVTQHWAIATGPSGPHGSLKTAVPTAQYTASHSVAPAVQRYASVPAELPLASSVFSAPQAGSVGQSSPLHTQCGARTCHPPPTATPAPPPRPITSQPQVDPHPPLEHASSQEQQLSSGESSEDSGGCTSEEDELEGVDVMPVRDTSCQTSRDRHTVMLSQKNKLPSPEKTARKVKTVKYLLGELKTLVAHQDSEAVRLIAEVEESVSLLPAMVGSTNVQAELALALQPLRSENVQLRRRLRILNQQLQERERAERQARPVDCNLELVSLQSLNFTLQTQLNDSHRELGSLRQENQRLRQALEEKENDLQHNREQCELETSRIRMDVHEALDEMRNCQAKFEHLERENGALTQSLHQKEAEITGLQEIIRDVGSTVEHCACTIPASYDGKSRHLQKSPTRNTACHFTQTEEPKPSSHLSRRVLDLHESQQEGNTVSSRVSESVQIYLQTLKGAGCAPEQSHALPQQLSPPSSDKWSATEDGCRLPEAQASSPKVLRVHRSAQHSAAKSWTQERGPRESHFVPPRETAAAAQKRFPVQPNGRMLCGDRSRERHGRVPSPVSAVRNRTPPVSGASPREQSNRVLQSKHYESVQMTEDDEVSAVTLMMWYNLFRANSTLVSEMGNNPLTSVTDEVVYKMSSSSNPVIGGTAVKVLLLIIEQHRPCIRLLHKHYKGLQELVWKDWRGKGFDYALELLVDQLQPESPEKVSKHFSEERAHAACVIQAAWRAHQTRCRIKKLPRAVSALQRSFRAKRQRQQEDAERRRAEEELRLQVQLRRQRAIRQLRQRQLHLMEILPADQVARYLGEMENRAALLIQRVWRGHRERRRFQQCQYQLRQHKAAVTLQRAILSFLQRRRSRRTVLAPWKGPRGLTDGRRTELRRQIEDHVCLYPSSVVSPEGTLELHEKAQSMLQQHLATRASDREQEQHRQALLAQINTDLELLLNAPSLKCVGREDSVPFLSRSAPVAMRARQSHNALLQNMRLPWWKTLGGEFSDPASLSQKDYNLDCDSLYLGDS